jgi:hypothetical protein
VTPALAIPARASEVTAEWLGAALDAPLRVERVERAGEEFGLASERLRVRLAGDGAPSSIVVKLWGFEDPSDAREVPFYRSFAARCGIRLPACLHAGLDERLGRAVLVLEDLRGAMQGDCLQRPTREQAVALAETLGAVHASWWARAELRDAAAWLPEGTVERSPEWIESRAPEFLREFGERLTPHARDLLERGAELQAAIHRGLDDAPATLLHGDLHLDNVLFEGASGTPVLLDWGRAARGPYALDLADLLFGVVPREDRAAALHAYASLVRARGAAIPEGATLHRHLDGALLRFFYRSTCGVVRWKPGTERERRMREEGVDRAIAAVAEWREEAQDQGSHRDEYGP